MSVAGERPRDSSGLGPEFGPSALGTKEHWDAAYESELQIFQESGDAGEIWFGEESMIRLIRWMEKQKIPLDSSVLDIGTGNGVLLVELAKSGYTNLTGIDYSPSAIQLSQNIIEKEGLSNIKLQFCSLEGDSNQQLINTSVFTRRSLGEDFTPLDTCAKLPFRLTRVSSLSKERD
uniref:EEF1A lysine methyltransferase 2 n=1 Tax=Terrapene triunguis TaxID=2587831 RepID=A0A674JXY1_9SAUR